MLLLVKDKLHLNSFMVFIKRKTFINTIKKMSYLQKTVIGLKHPLSGRMKLRLFACYPFLLLYGELLLVNAPV